MEQGGGGVHHLDYTLIILTCGHQFKWFKQSVHTKERIQWDYCDLSEKVKLLIFIHQLRDCNQYVWGLIDKQMPLCGMHVQFNNFIDYAESLKSIVIQHLHIWPPSA